MHAPYLTLPYYWDELGQFIPSALDILRDGAWIPHSAAPNVHPPGVMAYLALVWSAAGYTIPGTRIAMLLLASLGVYTTFLLAIRMSQGVPGYPAFTAALLLLATPLFYTQAMMAQLDMPAMTFTVLALLLFLERRYAWCAVVCGVLVLVKETGLLVPMVFGGWLVWRERQLREAVYFIAPVVLLAGWLWILHAATGHWLGDAGFAQYNVGYALNPVRAVSALLRRLWFLSIVDFRWIGTLAVIGAWRARRFFSREWQLAGALFAGHIVLVSLFGGATLERYLLPVIPLLYIAMATAFAYLTKQWRMVGVTALLLGMGLGFVWNPPYPFPYENNLAMTDFVELQQAAVEYVERAGPAHPTIATAWPYSSALHYPILQYVQHPLAVVETNDFHAHSLREALRTTHANVLIVYSRNWEPDWNIARVPLVERFLRDYYDYEPQMTAGAIEEEFGFRQVSRLTQHGQRIELYFK